eukprot:scaffold26902_cov65-Phaeocystis_antarctica.AAC.7
MNKGPLELVRRAHLAELLNCGRAAPNSGAGGALEALPPPWPPTTVLGRARGELRGELHAASAAGRGPGGGCGGASTKVGSMDEGGSGWSDAPMMGSGVRADSRGVSAAAGGWSNPRRWVPVASSWLSRSNAAPRASVTAPSGGTSRTSGGMSRGGGGCGRPPRCGWWKRKRANCSRAASRSWW